MTDRVTGNIEFPPIPLVSGQTFTAENGTEQRATEVTVVIRSESESIEVSLDFRFGGWWAPVA